MEERRNYIRVYEDIKVSYKYLGKEGGLKERAVGISQIINLVRLGLCFLCDRNFAGGDLLKFDFKLAPRPEAISVSGKVVWTELVKVNDHSIYEVGVRFVDIDPEGQAAIQQFVQNKLKSERDQRVKTYFAE